MLTPERLRERRRGRRVAEAAESLQGTALRHMRQALAEVDAARAGFSASAGGDGGYHSLRDTSGWIGTWNHGLRDAAGDTLPNLRTLRGQARDLSRNNGIAAAALETNVLRAIGTGLALSAQPVRSVIGWSEEQRAQWVDKVHAEWRLFADSTECDWRGVSTFDDLCEQACYGMLDSGDAFTVLPDGEPTATMPYRLRLQLIEADRVGNPAGEMDSAAVAGGIRFKAGRPMAAHVYERHPGSTYTAGAASGLWRGEWIDFVGPTGRRRILHHFRMLRPEQPRGVPYLAPVMALFKQIGTYADAEIKAAIVSAFHTVFIESDKGSSPAPVYDGARGEQTGEVARDEVALGPAAIIGLAAGEKANTSSPGRPNPQFGAFVQSVLDQLGAGLFIGSEMLMKKYNTSYVAARAAFLDAWKWLLRLRMTIVRTLCQPVYETWMAEAVGLGRIAAPGFFRDPLLRWAYTRAQWNGDSQGSINPKDEVAAYAAAIDNRLITRERAEWELFGTSWSDTYPTKKAEHDRLVEDGMLPVPKAGAAAPVNAPGQGAGEPAEPKDDGEDAIEGPEDDAAAGSDDA